MCLTEKSLKAYKINVFRLFSTLLKRHVYFGWKRLIQIEFYWDEIMNFPPSFHLLICSFSKDAQTPISTETSCSPFDGGWGAFRAAEKLQLCLTQVHTKRTLNTSPRRHSGGIWKRITDPQLTSFNVEEQRVYSKLLTQSLREKCHTHNRFGILLFTINTAIKTTRFCKNQLVIDANLMWTLSCCHYMLKRDM